MLKRRSNENEARSKKRAKVVEISTSQDDENGNHENNYRSGKILRVKLQNFMCHSNLVVDLHPNINFLVGRNGSGKSSILAALVLGLGYKASATSRSSNFRQFIKNDENFAVIDIEIENRGPSSYEFDVYGDKIIVSRRITANGASSYKIKSANGHTISTRTDELRKILMCLNIQADNPVFVLNQDNARSFLKDLDPKMNYDFFLKATQIESIVIKISENETSYKRENISYQYTVENNKILSSEIKELTQLYMELQTAEKNKVLLSEYRNKQNWCRVILKESSLKEISETILKLNADREIKLRKLADKDGFEKSTNDEIRQLENQMSKKDSIARNEINVQNSMREMVATKNENYLKEDRHLLKLREKCQKYREQIDDLKNHIRERQLESAISSTQTLKEDNEKQIQLLKTDLNEANSRIENVKLEIQMLLKTKEQIQEDHGIVNRQFSRLVEDVKTYTFQLNQITKKSQDNLAIYGPNVSAFVKSLEKAYREGHLSELPLGPIGRYITIPNEEFRCIIETILGGVLSSFIVNNTRDRNFIDNMLKRNFKQYSPTIITIKFRKEVYDVRSGKVATPSETYLLMDQINCSSNVVINTLIDRCAIEKILLTKNQSIAIHLTETIENVPENLSKIYLVNPGVEFHPATTSYRMYSLNLREPRFIQVNMAQRATQVKNELAAKINAVDSKQQQLNENKIQLDDIQRKISEKRTILDRHDRKVREIKEKLEEIESIEYPASNEFDILAAELTELNTRLSKSTSDITTVKALVEKTKEEKIEAEKQLQIQKSKIKESQDVINQLQEKIREHKNSLKSLTTVMKKFEIEVKELENDIKSHQERETLLLKELTECKKIAEKSGNRVETKESLEELNMLIRKLEEQLKIKKKNTGSKEDIRILIEEKQLQYNLTKELCLSLHATLKKLGKTIQERCNTIVKLKKIMSIRVQFIFANILKIRGFEGEIVMNHNDKKLDVSVVPRNEINENVVRNTKSLSGGERSFTTVAFLLALWSCIDHPFYFLDEYDVFTDKINQSIMTTLLIDEAKKNTNRQFTFLTPQSTSVQASKFIQIHRLNDPDMDSTQ